MAATDKKTQARADKKFERLIAMLEKVAKAIAKAADTSDDGLDAAKMTAEFL